MGPETDDTSARLAAWALLASPEGAPLVAATAGRTVPGVGLVEKLRKTWPSEAVAAAFELALARAKAHVKFPNRKEIWCDVPGIEQASSETAADWKARRFEVVGSGRAIDLGCGIGGDAMSIARVVDLLAIDIDPLRAWMTQKNAGCRTSTADLRQIDVDDVYIHLDPSRREESTSRRAWSPDTYRPPWKELLALIGRARGAACKLGPGIPVPLEGAPPGSELEFIQEGTRLVQAVLWTGDFVSEGGQQRRATLLPSGESLLGLPEPIPLGEDILEEGACLLEPRVSLERAGLIGRVLGELPGDPREAAPDIGLIASREPASSPWFIDWRVLAVLPMRERDVKAWLREHDCGEVVARTRGRAIDVDAWARSLRGKGSTRYTVFALRLGSTARALVCQPLG